MLKQGFFESFSKVCAWLKESGPFQNLIFSSRVRLARNISGLPFVPSATVDQQKTIVSYAKRAMNDSTLLRDSKVIKFEELDKVGRKFLMERYLISKEMAEGKGAQAVFVNSSEDLGVMVNEEDHLRLQSFKSGLQLKTAWEAINKLDDEIESEIEYSYSDELGYLTACPTNVGTGLRASVMIHVPALIMTRKLPKVFSSVAKSDCAVRGVHGEGSDVVGDFFQVSNQVTLGCSEETLVSNVERLAKDLIVGEQEAREELLAKRRKLLEDRVGRALGILTMARIMTLEEALGLLSAVRLGLDLGLLHGVSIVTLNELMIRVNPVHLEVHSGLGTSSAVDALRAELLRNEFRNVKMA